MLQARYLYQGNPFLRPPDGEYDTGGGDDRSGGGSYLVENDWIAKAVAIIPHFTGALSILGSLWILFEIGSDEKKQERLYHRLVMFMSFFDLMLSIWLFLSTWPVPYFIDFVPGAKGTWGTCVAQGAFLQLGLVVPLYNSFLSVYYLLVIRYNFTEHRLRERVEPWMHGIAVSLGLGTTIACFPLALFNPGIWCWIAPYPPNCKQSWRFGYTTCERGDNADLYQIFFFMVPVWATFLVSGLALASVCQYVYGREKAVNKFRFPSLRSRRRTGMPQKRAKTQAETEVPRMGEEIANNAVSTDRPSEAHPGSSPHTDTPLANEEHALRGATRTGESKTRRENDGGPGLGDEPSPNGRKRPSGVEAVREQVNRMRRRSTDDRHEGGGRGRYERSKSVTTLSGLYMLAFFITWIFPTISAATMSWEGRSYATIDILTTIFFPLQGFFNFCIYIRPRYMKYRKEHPELWAVQVFSKVIRRTVCYHRRSRDDDFKLGTGLPRTG